MIFLFASRLTLHSRHRPPSGLHVNRTMKMSSSSSSGRHFCLTFLFSWSSVPSLTLTALLSLLLHEIRSRGVPYQRPSRTRLHCLVCHDAGEKSILKVLCWSQRGRAERRTTTATTSSEQRMFFTLRGSRGRREMRVEGKERRERMREKRGCERSDFSLTDRQRIDLQ